MLVYGVNDVVEVVGRAGVEVMACGGALEVLGGGGGGASEVLACGAASTPSRAMIVRVRVSWMAT